MFECKAGAKTLVLRELENQSEHVSVVNQVKKPKPVDINLAAVLFWACFENVSVI